MLNIKETPNPFHNVKDLKPIREIQKIIIPGLEHNKAIPHRNGFFYGLIGSGGSGKSSMLMSMFKSKLYYRGIFDNIYYICPSISFQSVENHIFKDHDKVYHELTVDLFMIIYQQLNELKEGKDKTDSDSDSEPEIEYNCIIIDDFADTLKDKDIERMLNMMIIKARHLRCAFIFTLQSYYYFPKILRKQITYITIFKPKNIAEFDSIAHELLNLNKEDGLKLYNYIYDENYSHLDLDTVQNKVYKNFNELILKE